MGLGPAAPGLFSPGPDGSNPWPPLGFTDKNRKLLLARNRCGRAASVLAHGKAAMLEVAVKLVGLSGLLGHGRSPDQGAPPLALET